MRSFKQKIFLGLAAAAAVFSVNAQGNDRLSGPVKLLVGFPAGGTGDLVARVMAEKLTPLIGVPVIVENKPGAGGRIAAEQLKNTPADGTTVLIAPPAPMVIAPLTFRKLAYNAEKDFMPIAQLVRFPLSLAVGGNSPHKTLGDLTAWFKANPQQASFGTSAAGSQLHFLGLLYGQSIKVDIMHVPYQGGAPLSNDLMGGQIPAGIDQFSAELNKSGKMRLLATSGATRSPLLPDVPTFKEQGINIEGDAWFGAFVHASTPEPVAKRLSDALVQVARQADVRQKLSQAGLESTGLNIQEFTALVAADRNRWRPVIESSGFRGD